MSTSVLLPQFIEIGEGASQKVSDILTALGCRNPLIITDKTMVSLGQVELIQRQLTHSGMGDDVYDGTIPEPTDASILDGVKVLRKGSYDSLVALGGGSVIDSAKAMSVLAKSGDSMRDFKFPRIVSEAGLPLIAIPTTAGTGSETTRFTVITDEVSDEKMLCVGPAFMPVAALVDASLTLTLPARATADTGIDAMTHAMEAYVSKKANAFSDYNALEALRLIGPNLRTVCKEPKNRKAREDMMLGATLAGIAFSNASVALVHGMSRPIGAAFHVPHGLSNAMLLPIVTAYSIPAAAERYAECARAMGVANPQDSTASANQKLLEELEAINRELSVPGPKAFGIDEQQFFGLLESMAEQALASGSPGNNPRVPESDDIVHLYKQLWATAS
ncbi:iron-containing alcohol dehydrogenase [Enterovibrio norvegicus]|uniref:iron-containing alcohol dehydrogenase n=1 Tax=Enterovibrio norvegicus TaxID=188144 RepID=UPI000C852A85|nr:iron-containing alcohol dehydrogenase [Enterovibrio norvegicus]PML82146.1 alcohol dehydrogenase [Enterovibrio norvegicus]